MVQVFDAKGFSFLEGVRTAYPVATREEEPAGVVLERLEQICPGFVTWGRN
jgi:hypothetical protein